jgi:hypothetical protein
MSHFQPRLQKQADDGSRVIVCLDGHHAWFLERPEDREQKGNPLGAFRSEEAARTWGDRHFPGGQWQRID